MGLTGWSNGLWAFSSKVRSRSASPSLSLWLCVLLNFLSALATAAQTSIATESIPNNAYSGDKACEQCHSAIYESYRKTAMARASGPVQGNLIPGEFIHKPSHLHCKVSEEAGHAWLNFDREGAG